MVIAMKLKVLIDISNFLNHHKKHQQKMSRRATGSISTSAAAAAGGGKSSRERVDFDEKEDMEITTSGDIEVFSSFDELGLKEDLLRGIYAYGEKTNL